jgi:hypothetical protein
MSDAHDEVAAIRAAAREVGLELAPEALARVAAAFARNREMAQMVLDLELPEDVDPAATFRL